ncbi:right-handed parallel beta-helix repeat-containing protein [Rubritalea sp.]|uniref:right-handed parallel beta-helix repeat-containing protein n=1 Tax=Rubritalea sp. TaxID=2109375 RepID=UPI003EF2B7CA
MLVATRNKRQGNVLFRALIILLLVILGGSGVFLYLRSVEFKKLRVAKLERVAEAERDLAEKIQSNVNQAEVAISDGALDEAKDHLRRASLFDVNAAYQMEIARVTGVYLKAQRDKRREGVMKSYQSSLNENNFTNAIELIEGNHDLFNESDISKLRFKVEEKRQELLRKAVLKFKEALNHWELESADEALVEMELCTESSELVRHTKTLKARRVADKQARALGENIRSLDKGAFSPEVHHKISSALRNYPGHPELCELKQRLDTYLMEIDVPGDFASLEEALIVAPEKCHIRLGAGVFFIQVTIDKEMMISGLGPNVTILEGVSSPVPMLKIENKQGVVKLSELQLRGTDYKQIRPQSLVLIDGVSVDFSNVVITNSSGHGVEIASGAVRFESLLAHHNHNDGVAVHGVSSTVEMIDSELYLNGGSGCNTWEGASLRLSRCSAQNNAQSGVVAIGEGTALTVDESTVSFNTHSGVYVSKGARAKVSKSQISKNAHSGVFAQWPNTALSVVRSQITDNEEFGIVCDPQVELEVMGTEFEGNALGGKLLKIIR